MFTRWRVANRVRNLVRTTDQQAYVLGIYDTADHHRVDRIRIERLRIVAVHCTCGHSEVCERAHGRPGETIYTVIKRAEVRHLVHQKMRHLGYNGIP